MPAQGSVIVRVYTSDAYLPLANVPVTITRTLPDGGKELLAILRTDSSGLTPPLTVDTPEESQSLQPGATLRPYAVINIQVTQPGYSSVLAEGVQVFPGVETIQGLQLRPLPVNGTGSVVFEEPSQNL